MVFVHVDDFKMLFKINNTYLDYDIAESYKNFYHVLFAILKLY